MRRRITFLAVVLAILLMTGASPVSLAGAVPQSTTQQGNPSGAKLIDINSASVSQLRSLPGIGDAYAQKIVDGRPYTRKDQLVQKNIIPQSVYNKIAPMIIAKQPKSPKS